MTTTAVHPRAAEVLLADGTIAVIRPLSADDHDALLALHEAASDRSLRFRFFAVSRHAAATYVDHLCSGSENTLALVALLRGEIIATASAEVLDSATAEVAFMVADGAAGLGLGTLLLEHLAAAARDSGISSFVAEVLSDNHAMLRVFRDAGFTEHATFDRTTVRVELDTAESADAAARIDQREAHSEQNSLRPLLYPRALALYGVRRDRTGIGGAILDAIRSGGFTGPLYVVHPDTPELSGATVVTTLAGVTDHVDMAVIAVPADRATAAMTDAVAAKVSTVVVISSGFRELGEAGAELQREIALMARSNGIRLVGPNCLGVLANQAETRVNATFARSAPPVGGLAIASQSGGVGIALLDMATARGIGVHSFVSLGNKADVSGNDLLGAWLPDDNVTCAALYLESFGNAVKFVRVARGFSESKPIVAVVGGRSDGGSRAGASHTAAMATPGAGVDALFAQSGVIGCSTPDELADTAYLLQRECLPRGSRLAIISNAGGVGVLAADIADAGGITVPALSDPLQQALGDIVNGTVGTSNPVDLGAGVPAGKVGEAVRCLTRSGEVDVVVVALVATRMASPDQLVAAVAEARGSAPEVPVVLVQLGEHGAVPAELSTYDSIEAAVGAIGRVMRYAQWRRMPVERPPAADPVKAHAARRFASTLLEGLESRWLLPDLSGLLLARFGVRTEGAVAYGVTAAADAADRAGYPVVVKAAAADVVHKTDRGLVRVGLTTRAAVVAAYEQFAAELGTVAPGVLVQPQLDGVEMVVGVVRQAGVGPLVMVGAGGVAVDLWRDRVFMVPPFSGSEVARALRSLRCWPLLEGYRGSPRTDIEGFVRVVVGVGRLAVDVPEVAELDLNPVLVAGSGAHAVDVKLRLSPAAVGAHGRQLRPIAQ